MRIGISRPKPTKVRRRGDITWTSATSCSIPGDIHLPVSAIDVRSTSTGQLLAAAPPEGVLASSADLGWSGLTVELHRLRAMEMPEHVINQHRLMIHAGEPTRFEWREGGEWRSTRLDFGSFNLQADGELNEPRWHDRLEFVAVAIDPSFATRVFGDVLDGRAFQLATRRGGADPVIARFARLFRRELVEPTFHGALFGETLGIAFARHLLDRHRAGDGPLKLPSGRLTGAQLTRVLAYLYDNLGEDIGLEAIAAEAGMSAFHFARLFKATVGLSPHQLVIKLKVDRARQLIRAEPQLTMTEIAVAAGFYDQAHFTKVFRRAVGVTPAIFAGS